MDIPTLTQNIISRELRPARGEEGRGRAAFQVCEKLREPLCVLAGTAGYRSLLSRALVLARRRSPWLGGVKCGSDATLVFAAEHPASFDSEEAARGGAILVAELLGLLSTLIGDALTLRLVRNVWPDVDASPSNSNTDSS